MIKKNLAMVLLIISIAACKKSNSVTDKIAGLLTTSKGAYDSARTDSWVHVSAGEYQNVLNGLTAATTVGSSDSIYNGTTTTGWFAGFGPGGEPYGKPVPASNYIVAWSVSTGPAAISSYVSAAGSKLKISTQQTTGYMDYGSPLPDIGQIPSGTKVYFVLKTPSKPSAATGNSYVEQYCASRNFIGAMYEGTNITQYYTQGDSSYLSFPFHALMSYQLVVTPTKQW